MWNFIKRQLKTKTGKLVAGVIVGSVVDSVAKNTIGVGASEIPMIGQGLDQIFGSQTSTLMLGLSYLRDQKAKDVYDARDR